MFFYCQIHALNHILNLEFESSSSLQCNLADYTPVIWRITVQKTNKEPGIIYVRALLYDQPIVWSNSNKINLFVGLAIFFHSLDK